jgi:hypothetical protein
MLGVVRQFRFRVREGHQIHTFGDGGTTHGAGYEFVLTEKEAAALFRDPSGRRGFELVEILTEDAEAAMARGETTAD